MSVRITDNSDEVLEALHEAVQRGLETRGQVAQDYARKNITRQKAVDTGALRDDISRKVADDGIYIGTK